MGVFLARRRLSAPPLLLLLYCLALLSASVAASDAARHERLRVALDATAQRVGQALAALTTAAAAPEPASSVAPFSAGTPASPSLAAAAREDCAELLEASLDLLAGAGAPAAARDDAVAWLSAALTNHDTCADGLAEAGVVSHSAAPDAHLHLAAARAMVRDSLAMYVSDAAEESATAAAAAATHGGLAGDADAGNSGCGCKNETAKREVCGGLQRWLPARDRRLLLSPAAALADSADIVVAKDGTGTHATISDAVKAAPECSERRTVIYVKAGRYDEIVRVGTKKTNLVFVGDGKGVTVVAGGRSAADNYTTFQTATFGASGSGFMMRDMTVVNWAGPAKHQAVALRVGADRAVVHRCSIVGYQDTLYAHSNRQFYRDCDVYGTVDFVFGNAAAVLQRCNLWARAPLPKQNNTVTAQNRREPCQDTGLVLHDCRVVPAPDLVAPASPSPAPAPAPAAGHAPPLAPTYLGRPWRSYSRVVVMMSYIGAHVSQEGWVQWNASTSELDTLYYGEYMNYGPGAGVAGRVPWRGHHVINDTVEAERFTVAQFIAGASWLPATGVSFVAGLSV